ncbi:hypothetical protein BDV18DRAFT_140850 [Aspergillus unguis]
MASLKPICANWAAKNTGCNHQAKSACAQCLLVAYCSPACQKEHWPLHKVRCKAELNTKDWHPAWSRENRVPMFAQQHEHQSVGLNKNLWGNVPAIDVVQLEKNEGKIHNKKLTLLFGASGDLHNVVKTLADLPDEYNRSLDITINGSEFDAVARNVILLLVSLVVEDKDEAVDLMIHLWYSAFITASHVKILQQQIQPLIDKVALHCKKHKAPGTLTKTWHFGSRTLRLSLHSSEWTRLSSMFQLPEGLTVEKAKSIRRSVMMNGKAKDATERKLYCMRPPRRQAHVEFRAEGILLPFEYPQHGFIIPNLTLFRDLSHWPFLDNADPLHGWSSKDVAAFPTGPATEDAYGKLYFYLQSTMGAFLKRLKNTRTSFTMYNLEVTDLPRLLKPDTFDRIEISNAAEPHWLGIERVLRLMMPFLQKPTKNPHATLITLFRHAIGQSATVNDILHGSGPRHQETRRRLKEYLPFTRFPQNRYDPDLAKYDVAWDIVNDWDHVFKRFMETHKFSTVGQSFNAAMKEPNTIIDRAPFQLKLQPGEEGAQEEFEQRFCDGVSGQERYVEWRRTDGEAAAKVIEGVDKLVQDMDKLLQDVRNVRLDAEKKTLS